MKKRDWKTLRTNVIMIAVTAIIIAVYSASAKAATTFNSQGRIVFDNGTADTSDDVIFDANDFNVLYERCK